MLVSCMQRSQWRTKTHPAADPNECLGVKAVVFGRLACQKKDLGVLGVASADGLLELLVAAEFEIAEVVEGGQGLGKVDVLEGLGEALLDEGGQEHGRQGARLVGHVLEVVEKHLLEVCGRSGGGLAIESVDCPQRQGGLVGIGVGENVVDDPEEEVSMRCAVGQAKDIPVHCHSVGGTLGRRRVRH